MPDDEAVRLFAKDVGLDPPISGHDNVQDVLTAGVGPVGPAGGDLAGTYPNPTVPALATLAPINNPTFTGEVIVPAAVNPTDAVQKQQIPAPQLPTFVDTSPGGITLTEHGSGAIQLIATGTGAIAFDTSTGTGVVQAVANNAINFVNNGPSGIELADNGAGGILVQATGPLKLRGASVGIYAADPVAQKPAIAAPAGGAIIDVQARAAITAILNALGAAAGGIGITA